MAKYRWSSLSTEIHPAREPMVIVVMESMPSARTMDAIIFSEYVWATKKGNSIIFIFPSERLKMAMRYRSAIRSVHYLALHSEVWFRQPPDVN